MSTQVDDLPELERSRAADFLFAAFGLAVEMWHQKGDPAAPAWTEWQHPWRKYGGDNPGTVYLSAPVSPRHQYRIRGPLAGAHYVGVQLYRQVQGFNDAAQVPVDHQVPEGDVVNAARVEAAWR